MLQYKALFVSRPKKYVLFLLMAILASNAYGTENNDSAKSYIGTNVARMTDYSGDWPFFDRMKSARKWITFDSTEVDKTWDTKTPLPLDQNGYPLQIPFDPDNDGPIAPQAVRTILFNNSDQYPKGKYTVVFEGRGKIHFRVDATCPHLPNGQCVFAESGVEHIFEVKKTTGGGIRMKILESDANDHIRNIKVLMPGYEKANSSPIFHTSYLERLKGFKILRFMDWASTNHSQERNWNDRVTPEYYTFAEKGKGAPLEYMIALSNEMGADAWFTIPTLATDDYVRQAARLIHSTLNPDLKLYLEYSNEVWNGIFPQEDYATAKGHDLARSLGLEVGNGEANAYFYARRSAEVFKIFGEEIPPERRLVKVVAGQGMNPWVLERILYGLNDARINPTGEKADSIAIALYFGISAVRRLMTQNGKLAKKDVKLSDIERISLDDIFAEARVDLLERRKPNIKKHKMLADRNNVSLISYEGGQSLTVGFGYGREPLDAMTEKIIRANRDPRMKQLYNEMFDTWFDSGGTHFLNFSYINQPSRWGAWGLLEYQSQPIEEAYKYQALQEAILEIEKANRKFSTE